MLLCSATILFFSFQRKMVCGSSPTLCCGYQHIDISMQLDVQHRAGDDRPIGICTLEILSMIMVCFRVRGNAV